MHRGGEIGRRCTNEALSMHRAGRGGRAGVHGAEGPRRMERRRRPRALPPVERQGAPQSARRRLGRSEAMSVGREPRGSFGGRAPAKRRSQPRKESERTAALRRRLHDCPSLPGHRPVKEASPARNTWLAGWRYAAAAAGGYVGPSSLPPTACLYGNQAGRLPTSRTSLALNYLTDKLFSKHGEG